MPVITMKQLLEAGVHFGHQTRRWNPRMAPYIYGERNGIHILDLRQTLEQSERAYAFIRDLVADAGIVLFVGTKKQAADAIGEAGQRSGMPYVNFRWYGGMLTNFTTIHKRIFYMHELERMDQSGEMEALPKKERLRLRRELDKLRRELGGVATLSRVPDAMFIIDLNAERIAVKEGIRLGIPIVALVDTNCDPEGVTVVIPGNDDAIRASQAVAGVIADACVEGRRLAGQGGEEPPSSPPTRVAVAETPAAPESEVEEGDSVPTREAEALIQGEA